MTRQVLHLIVSGNTLTESIDESYTFLTNEGFLEFMQDFFVDSVEVNDQSLQLNIEIRTGELIE